MTNESLVLAVETSGRMGSVAIATGGKMLAEIHLSGPMRHSSEVFPAIAGLLNRFSRKPREIEQIYISVGPGSFTGLRIAVSIAKTMHLANNVKIAAVDTLDVIAVNADDYRRQGKANVEQIAVVLDAKRGQFYIAAYQYTGNEQPTAKDGIWEKIFPDSLMTPSQFLEQFADEVKPIWLLGEGLVYYADIFKAEGIYFLDESCWTPRAEKVHMLGWKMACAGQFVDPLMLQPKYLRKPQVTEKRKT